MAWVDPLDFLETLGVPARHPFHREALLAWWFVPPRHEPEFYRVVGHLWLHPDRTPRVQSRLFVYFRSVVPSRSYHEFHSHVRALLKSRQFFLREEP
jgi:hypothetical protein